MTALRFYVGVPTSCSKLFVGLGKPGAELFSLAPDRSLIAEPYRLLLHPGSTSQNRFIVAVVGVDENEQAVGFGKIDYLASFSANRVLEWKVVLRPNNDEIRNIDVGCNTWSYQGDHIIFKDKGATSCDPNPCLTVNFSRVYWSDYGVPEIRSATIDGVVEPPIITDALTRNYGIVFNQSKNELCWVDYATPTIECVNSDGTNRRIQTITGTPRGLALNSRDEKLYWTDTPNGTIWRADNDFTNIEPWVEGLTNPFGIDISEDQIYWIENEPALGSGAIKRINVDDPQADPETIYEGIMRPRGIAVDALRDTVYWTDSDGPIGRIRFDGSNLETDLVPGTQSPRDIAIDNFGGGFFWIDETTRQIHRANLDGTTVESLVDGLKTPRGIALGN